MIEVELERVLFAISELVTGTPFKIGKKQEQEQEQEQHWNRNRNNTGYLCTKFSACSMLYLLCRIDYPLIGIVFRPDITRLK